MPWCLRRSARRNVMLDVWRVWRDVWRDARRPLFGNRQHRSELRVVAAVRAGKLVFIAAPTEALLAVDPFVFTHPQSALPAVLEVVGHARLLAVRTGDVPGDRLLAMRAENRTLVDCLRAVRAGAAAEALLDGDDGC